MLHTMTDETFELMLKVHNTAPFRIIREAAPYLRLKDAAGLKANKSIVNVSSTSGLHGNVGQANYAVAKAGIVGLTKVGSFTLAKLTVAHRFASVDCRQGVGTFQRSSQHCCLYVIPSARLGMMG